MSGDSESSGQFLARIGIDAEKWASEFLARFAGQYNIRESAPGTGFGFLADSSPGSEMHHTVQGWFANAIGAGQADGYSANMSAESTLRTRLALAEVGLKDWAEFNDELDELLGDYLPEVDGDGSHHSVLIDCVRAALSRAHEMGANGEPEPVHRWVPTPRCSTGEER